MGGARVRGPTARVRRGAEAKRKRRRLQAVVKRGVQQASFQLLIVSVKRTINFSLNIQTVSLRLASAAACSVALLTQLGFSEIGHIHRGVNHPLAFGKYSPDFQQV